MTVQFPQIDTTEPRLLPDSSKQTSADRSFEEKLKFEQARIGLLFSPFAQLESLFAANFYAGLANTQAQPENNIYTLLEQARPPASEPAAQNSQAATPTPPTAPQLFESIPTQSFSRQFLQQLLAQTGWLVPNLQLQPLFAQALAEGKLQPKFDLQFLVDQIAEQVKLVKNKDETQLSLTLKPKELGDILLVLTSHSGTVTISIRASQETKKLLDDRRAELENALKKAHVKFDRIQVQEVGKHA